MPTDGLVTRASATELFTNHRNLRIANNIGVQYTLKIDSDWKEILIGLIIIEVVSAELYFTRRELRFNYEVKVY